MKRTNNYYKVSKDRFYRLEYVVEILERDGQGQYRRAPAVKVASREFENVLVSVNQFHTDVMVQNSFCQ